MNSAAKVLLAAAISVGSVNTATAQDWSQWRGVNRDGKATAFKAPVTWPKELSKKWSVSIGDGVATPSLVGDRLYVFSRQDGNEIARCLSAADGTEIWRDSYASEGTSGGASGFQGPRCSPTVVDGKVVTLGVRGVLSCLDAATGKVLWRKDDFPGQWPQFYTSSSPIVVDGLCVAELGGEGEKGAIVAYDLESGEEKWRVPDLGPSYGSPMLADVNGTAVIIAPTQNDLVGVAVSDGKLLWKIPYTQGRTTSATPIVVGDRIVLAGPGSGISSIALSKGSDELQEEQLWTNTDNSVSFSSPVLKDGLVFGLANNNTLFCIDTTKQATAWSAPLGGPEPPSPFGPGPFGPGGRGDGRGRDRPDGERRDGLQREGEQRNDQSGQGAQRKHGIATVQLVSTTEDLLAQATSEAVPEVTPPTEPPAAEEPRGDGERRGDGRRRWGGRGRGRGGRGGGGGYGSIVDADSVLMVLTPSMELVVYEPSAEAYKELGRYKVSETPTYAYPVASGNRIFVKDQDAVTLWTVE